MELFFLVLAITAKFAVWVLFSLIVAFLVETLIEYFLGYPFDYLPENLKKYKPLVLRYLAAIAGVFLCLFFRIDLLYVLTSIAAIFGGTEPIIEITTPGMVITGLAVGHGSSYLHDFIKAHLPSKTAG